MPIAQLIDLVSDLSKICPDKTVAAILNRLGYKTGQEKTWNASRVAGLRDITKSLLSKTRMTG